MPFLAPIIGAVIGGIAATTIGQAVIGAALSVAMGAIARRLAPTPESRSLARGAHLRLTADSQMPRLVILGEAAVAGSLVYHNVYNNTSNLELVFALADHECEAMTGLWVNGKSVTWHADTGLVDEYPGMRVRFYSGAWGQAADSDLIANSGGRWTSDFRGRGIAYAYVNLAFNAQLYQGRQPTMLFRIKGARLYDWRRDSTAGGSGAHRWGTPSTYEWSDNPAVAWYNYRRGIFVNGVRVAGMATAADAMPLDAATAAANACDESVGVDAGGTEKRYRIAAAIVTAQKHREVIRDIAACIAGEEIDTGGELRLAPGITQSPVMALTDDDLMLDGDVEWVGKQSRRDMINAVFGSFRDPAQRYEAVSLVPRVSSEDEATDGGRFETRYDLDMVSSGTQAQRVLEIMRRRARRQGVAKGKFRAKTAVLEPGDWVTWTSSRFGWDLKTFEVVSAAINRDLSTELVLREIDGGIYAWTAADDELDSGEVPDLPSGGDGITALSGVSVETFTLESTSPESTASRPGLRLLWTPVTDPSIVAIDVEVRRLGDSVVSGTRRILDPSTGQSSWVDGIQGSTEYEVRARPVAMPARTTTWSTWLAAEETDTQVVDVGTAEIAPGSIGPTELDAQTRFELSLTTALEALQGSAGERAREATDRARRAAAQALRGILDAHDAKTLVRTETVTRETETTALASQITTISTTVAGHTATLTEYGESIDGISARWGIAINADGQVVGLVQLSGDATGATFTVLSDKFVVAKPDGTGGVPIFVVGTNAAGANQVGINGGLLINGTITAAALNVATLSAIVANLGTITAGKMQSADGLFRIDLDAKSFIMDAA